MKNLWKSYLEWNKKRQQKRFQWWVKKREKGHPRFVLGFAFIYSGAMVISTSISDYYFDGLINWGRLPFKIILWLVTGIIIGAVAYWDNERKHQKMLKTKTTLINDPFWDKFEICCKYLYKMTIPSMKAFLPRSVISVCKSIIVLITLAFLLQCSTTERLPSDAELENLLAQHKSEFERLIQMAQEDSSMFRITPTITTNGSNMNAELQLSDSRWQEYKQLFQKLKLNNGLLNDKEKQDIYLYSAGRGVIMGGEVKGYVYTNHILTPTNDSLDELPKNLLKERKVYKKIDEHWYLVLEMD